MQHVSLNNMRKVINTLTSIEFFLALVYVLLLLAMTVPYGFPLFAPVVFVYFLIFFMKDASRGEIHIRINLGIFLFLLSILFYFLGVVASHGVIYKSNIRDLKNIASLLMLTWILNRVDWESYNKFAKIFQKLTVPILSFVALFSLYNFYRLIAGSDVIFISMEKAEKAIGISLSGAYNMFALGMFGGIFVAYASFYRSKSSLFKLVCLACIILCSAAIVFSGSRRGWILLSFLGATFLVRGGVRLVKGFFVGEKGNLVSSRSNVFAWVFTIALSAVILVVVWDFEFNVEKPRGLNKLVYRLSTLSAGEGGFSRAFSKRTDRWIYAAELIEDSGVQGLFFGSGFEFLKLYGRRDGVDEGDPHNFIVSAMLYSGFIGSISLLGLILYTILRLFMKREKFGSELLLLYITALVFSITGAPSLFSVRLIPVISLTTFSVKD